MSQFDKCRVCFTENIRMHPLHTTQYQEVYEKHTGAKLIDEARFDKVCYLCNSLLMRFNKFMQMSQDAEKYLSDTYYSDVELTPRNKPSLSSKMHCFTNKAIQCLTLIETEDPPVKETLKAEDPPVKETLHSVLEDVAVKIESLDFEEAYLEEDYNIDVENINIDDDDNSKLVEIEFPKQSDIKISDVRVTLERLPLPKIRSKRNVHCCQHCPRRFRSAALLRRHKCQSYTPSYLQAIRHGRRQYVCQLCNRHFNHKSMFLVHHRTHTGEKPFKCTMCDRVFNDKSNCRKHIKTHITLSEKHACIMCDRTFSERICLMKHAVEHIL